jgi:hypothetical protein
MSLCIIFNSYPNGKRKIFVTFKKSNLVELNLHVCHQAGDWVVEVREKEELKKKV